MQTYSTREGARLEALWRSALLDSPPEPAFDRITALVCRVLGVPVALVSLVDADRQFFKSALGLAEPWASRRQTPLSHSFCKHVVTQETPLVVDDARHHPLVCGNLAIPDLGVIAYLGVPLRTPDGHVLGALCAIEDQPRHWQPDEVAVLEDLAAALMSELAARHHARQRQAADAQVQREKDYLTLLVEVQQVLATSQMAVQPLMRLVACQSQRLVPHADGTAVLDRVPEGLVLRAASGVLSNLEGRCVDARHSLAGAALAAGSLLQASDTLRDPRVDQALCREAGIRSMVAVPLRYRDQPLGVLCVVSTARHQAFTEAEVYNLRLLSGLLAAVMGHARAFEEKQRMLEQRTRDRDDLARARDAAEAADRAKSAFLGRMSHEIRTPMNGIIGLSQVLAEMPLPADAHAYVRMISTSGNALMKVLNDVLDVSKLEAGRLQLEPAPFSVAEVVEEVLDLLAVPARKKGLTLHRTMGQRVPHELVGDAYRIRQILLNLLDNAVKFTDAGSISVAVDVEGEAPDALRLVLRVSDTGPGIAPEDRAHLFEAFTQADGTTTRRQGGAGLGLALARQLAALMDGTVEAVSRPEGGTTFVCRLSVVPGSPDDRPLPERVLLVDDRVDDALPSARHLEAWGVAVTRAHSLSEAMAWLWQPGLPLEPFDMVLVRADGLDGEGPFFASVVHALPGRAALPVLELHGLGLPAEASQPGVGYLPEACPPAHLRAALAALLYGAAA